MEGEPNHLEGQARSEVAFAGGKLYVVEHCPKSGQWAGHPGLRDTRETILKYDQI